MIFIQLSLEGLIRGLHWRCLRYSPIDWLSVNTNTSLVSNEAQRWPGLNSSPADSACCSLIAAARPRSRSAVIPRETFLSWAVFLREQLLKCSACASFIVSYLIGGDDASQGQTEREPEGHFYRNLCHGIVEAHVEFLRNGLEQHPSKRQKKNKIDVRKEKWNTSWKIVIRFPDAAYSLHQEETCSRSINVIVYRLAREIGYNNHSYW